MMVEIYKCMISTNLQKSSLQGLVGNSRISFQNAESHSYKVDGCQEVSNLDSLKTLQIFSNIEHIVTGHIIFTKYE